MQKRKTAATGLSASPFRGVLPGEIPTEALEMIKDAIEGHLEVLKEDRNKEYARKAR